MESMPKAYSDSKIEEVIKPEGLDVEKTQDEKKKMERYNMYKERGWSDEEIEDELIYDAVSEFHKNKFSEEVWENWVKEYADDPPIFFDNSNYEKLQNIPQEKRLVYLLRASRYLKVTPDMASKHFAKFPEDLKAVQIIFESTHGFPETCSDIELFSLCALDLDKKDPDLKKRFNYLNDSINISKRRNFAPNLLMNGFKEHEHIENLHKYGKGSEGFLKLMDRAGDFAKNMRYPIDPESMLTDDYTKMKDEDKARFLRECVSAIQMHLVFDEIYNAHFTEEEEDEMKKRVIDQTMKGADVFNERHSMVYKTYHPISIYKPDQKKFDCEMDHFFDTGGPVEEYPYEKILLVVLKELKKVESQNFENTDTLVDFWNKNRNPLFVNAISDALSLQNPERASSQLLKLIKEEKDDKRPLSAVLYRLEFGKIGISEEGVKYLEKMYDLGEYNNSDYHVSRLTADGEVGVFDEELKLIKYFQLGDLSTDKNKVQAEVMDFVYETLFYGKSDERPEERSKREKYLQDFKDNYYKIANENVFNQTGVRLNNLSFKEQGWFVIYYNQAEDEAKDKLKKFVQEYGEGGIKTFLSLESGGEDMGGKILEIGEKLKDQPEVADMLFSEYAIAVNDLNINGDELCKIYEEIFFEKKLDKNEVSQAILDRASNLLLNGIIGLEKADQGEQKEIIEKIIKDFKRQIIANKKEMKELKEIAQKLNEEYQKITSTEDDVEDWNNFLGDWMKNEAPKELSEDGIKRVLTDIEKHKHFDSQRIKEMIEFYKKMTFLSDDQIKIMREVGKFSDQDLKRIKESLDKDDASYYGPKIKQLEKILPYQIAFEQKFEKIIFGKESIDFSNEILSDLDEEIADIKKEKIPEQKPLYFPVGISSDFEKWKEVFEGRAEMTKAIDIYPCLFWLNNQGKDAILVVCDEPQKYNYVRNYGKDPKEAEEFALKVGKKEMEYYKRIISTYNLSNIEVIDYRESLKDKRESFDHYMDLAIKLSKNKLLSELFLNMVPESVKKTRDHGSEEYIEYALEDLAFTLSIDGTKVSHKNEARYDIIAAIIKNLELSAKENNIELLDENGEITAFAGPLILKIRDKLRDKINSIKNKLDRDSAECGYYNDMAINLKKIKGKSDENINIKDLAHNFVVPSVGSQSMAIIGREKRMKNKLGGESGSENEGIVSVVKFKEPYSTYFRKKNSSIICRDQISAFADGLIGFRVQSLEEKEQIKYTKKVLKPLLIHYFKTLENVTPDFFRKAGVKDKNEILNECKKCANISDLIRFIQKNIIKPVSS